MMTYFESKKGRAEKAVKIYTEQLNVIIAVKKKYRFFRNSFTQRAGFTQRR